MYYNRHHVNYIPEAESYVKVGVAARHLGLSSPTVKRLARQGKIPSCEVDGILLFRLSEIDAAIKKAAH